MFDFEKLEVYKNSKETNKSIINLLKKNKEIYSYLRNQLHRASISVVINIAEGSGRFTKADKRNFYIIARGSVYECVSLLEIIREDDKITKEEFQKYYDKYEIISKMLFGLINSQK